MDYLPSKVQDNGVGGGMLDDPHGECPHVVCVHPTSKILLSPSSWVFYQTFLASPPRQP